MPVSSVTEHWIKPDAVTINLNHFGDPDYLQVSVLAGAVVMAFKQDVIAYNAAHNYRTWPLQAANTYLETTSAYNVYARLTRSEVNASALIVYDPILRDIEGRPILFSEDGTEILGEADPAYFYVFLGQISESLDNNGNKKDREWLKIIQYGSLDSSEQKNNIGSLWAKLFKPHYDDPDDPEKLSWIEAKANMGVLGGVTMFVKGDNVNIPTIAEGLPFDGKTIWYNPSTKQIEVIGGTGGGTADAVAWDNIIGKPTWIGSTKPTYNYSEIQGTPDLSKYALASDIPSLSGYATQSWVESKGYALNSELTALSTKVNDFLEGSDTDTIINKWLELEAFLSGLSESDNLATILGTKADKTYVDGNFVTLTTQQTISGEKNFTGGLKVNGSPIVYDAINKYWKLEGDLLVTGGVTMYSSDTEFTPSTIMDAIVVDNVTIVKQDGKLVAVGGGSSGGGVADSVAWDNVLGKPSWITDTIPYVNIAGTKVSLGGSITQAGLRTALGLGSNAYSSTAYLPLSGGAITASGVPLTINRTGYTVSAIHFQVNSVNVGRIGVGEDNNPKFMKAADGTWHNLWHAGNDGAGSGLDADLLDGKHYSDIINGNVASAAKLQTARTIWGQSFDGTADITGDLKLGLSRILGVDDALLVTSSTDAVTFGYGTSVKGIPTYIDGNVINFRYGTTRAIGMILNSNGGLTIGTSDLASSSYKLYVGGATRITGNILFGGEIYKPIPSGGTYKPFRIIQTADYALIQVSSHDGVSANGVLQLAGGLNGILSRFNVLAGTSYISGKLGLGVSAPTEKLHVAGNILATGGVTMYSMRSLKNVVDERGLSLEELSVIKPTRYTWRDGRDNKTHIGGIADDVMKVLPEVVYKTEGGVLTMDYGNAGFAIASSLIKPIISHEQRIADLEAENKRLKEEIELLKWNIA